MSFLVSASGAAGMTEGWLEAGDGERFVRLEADHAVGAVAGLVEHDLVQGRSFCRLMLTALELDDTRRPEPGPSAPRRFAFAISLRKGG